ncbi:hypothetical protein TGFOU_220208A [Toxoplasma gondii FOU]|uniref:Uncharacterized protein n=1 Tax=Toxoplasma gondii FOU TaxID=943167 RepID=A0A086JTN6_TOXGO|nr:hypothetical protein TGFOU_220208A [Toxoplasma gondii FOU]
MSPSASSSASSSPSSSSSLFLSPSASASPAVCVSGHPTRCTYTPFWSPHAAPALWQTQGVWAGSSVVARLSAFPSSVSLFSSFLREQWHFEEKNVLGAGVAPAYASRVREATKKRGRDAEEASGVSSPLARDFLRREVVNGVAVAYLPDLFEGQSLPTASFLKQEAGDKWCMCLPESEGAEARESSRLEDGERRGSRRRERRDAARRRGSSYEEDGASENDERASDTDSSPSLDGGASRCHEELRRPLSASSCSSPSSYASASLSGSSASSPAASGDSPPRSCPRASHAFCRRPCEVYRQRLAVADGGNEGRASLPLLVSGFGPGLDALQFTALRYDLADAAVLSAPSLRKTRGERERVRSFDAGEEGASGELSGESEQGTDAEESERGESQTPQTSKQREVKLPPSSSSTNNGEWHRPGFAAGAFRVQPRRLLEYRPRAFWTDASDSESCGAEHEAAQAVERLKPTRANAFVSAAASGATGEKGRRTRKRNAEAEAGAEVGAEGEGGPGTSVRAPEDLGRDVHAVREDGNVEESMAETRRQLRSENRFLRERVGDVEEETERSTGRCRHFDFSSCNSASRSSPGGRRTAARKASEGRRPREGRADFDRGAAPCRVLEVKVDDKHPHRKWILARTVRGVTLSALRLLEEEEEEEVEDGEEVEDREEAREGRHRSRRSIVQSVLYEHLVDVRYGRGVSGEKKKRERERRRTAPSVGETTWNIEEAIEGRRHSCFNSRLRSPSPRCRTCGGRLPDRSSSQTSFLSCSRSPSQSSLRSSFSSSSNSLRGPRVGAEDFSSSCAFAAPLSRWWGPSDFVVNAEWSALDAGEVAMLSAEQTVKVWRAERPSEVRQVFVCFMFPGSDVYCKRWYNTVQKTKSNVRIPLSPPVCIASSSS